MKKILLVTLVLILVFGIFSAMSVSARIIHPDIDGGIRAALIKDPDAVLHIFVNAKADAKANIPSLYDYILEKGFDENRVNSDEEYRDMVYAKRAEDYAEEYAAVTEEFEALVAEIYPEGAPEDVIYDPTSVQSIQLHAGVDKIIAFAEHEDVYRMGLMEYPEQTEEEKALLSAYYAAHSTPDEEVAKYTELTICGVVDGYTLFRINWGYDQPAMVTVQRLGDVIITRNMGANLVNPCGIELVDEKGNFSNLTEVYELGEIDIMKVWEILPNAYLVGDVNSDDRVNIKDSTAMQKQIARGETQLWHCDPYYQIFDVNEDEVFNIKDATAVQKMIAEIGN